MCARGVRTRGESKGRTVAHMIAARNSLRTLGLPMCATGHPACSAFRPPMISFPPANRGQTELFGEPDRLALLSQAAHIVIIDDEVANVTLLARLLERAGFQSITALTDASELPALLVQSPLDLVITDLHMPGIDGFGVLDLLRAYITLERQPVLMITGVGSRDARTEALVRAAEDVVTNTFDMGVVLLGVRNLIEGRRR